ncbi:MAG: undecaprenyl-diphosphate phosphatase, partial [Flavobacteriaceae bacterium]|nr:undecaprenyl-diphosphate phosphatase [Flavobacteriaceae bacterium]
MDLLESILLGIVQGLTEFLPVSSSGHLEIGKAMLGDISVSEDSLIFTVVLHFATALSTIIVFRKDILIIISQLIKFDWNEDTQFIVKIIISILPAGFIGLLFEEELESLFGDNIAFVGGMLLVTALLLILADRAKETNKKVGFWDAFIIGVSQAVAMLPGISRSGAT